MSAWKLGGKTLEAFLYIITIINIITIIIVIIIMNHYCFMFFPFVWRTIYAMLFCFDLILRLKS